MATFNSDAAAANNPAKSGIRDSVKVPFSVTIPVGTTLAASDKINLIKVSPGHRVVGYYLESGAALDPANSITTSLGYTVGGVDFSTAFTGTTNFGRTANVNNVMTEKGTRTGGSGGGAAVAQTYTAAAIPSPEFSREGVVTLFVVAGSSGALTAAGSINGYVEVQPA